MKKTEITYSIPGGWCGNDPGNFRDEMVGNVTIDPGFAHQALKWLARRAEIMSTWVTPDHGLCINYKLKK